MSAPEAPENDAILLSPKGPFDSAHSSKANSKAASTTGYRAQERTYFHSRRIKKGSIERPWLEYKDPRQKWVTIMPVIGIVLGLFVSAALVYQGLTTVTKHEYCLVYEDDFSRGWNSKVWTKEVEVGGFGNGQFEETTNTDENVFIRDGMLILKPTLQNAELIHTDNVLNLTKLGTCTSDLWSNCVTGTNTTNGTIINPVKSARINTKGGVRIRYGRVEVKAKIPAGEWLWPAIWMLPVNDTYGAWPASGEIDIMESRGMNYSYPQGGNNIVTSTLHWGPDSQNDQWWRNTKKQKALHTTFDTGYYTFGLEWSEKYIFTYINGLLMQVLYTPMHIPFWQVGDFPPADANGTNLIDPWSQTGRCSTPFDQDFYLILNVAVGGTNGWFEDGVQGKPWVDASPTAKRDFWNARDQWYPSWQDGGEMAIKSVKMWQQKGHNGC